MKDQTRRKGGFERVKKSINRYLQLIFVLVILLLALNIYLVQNYTLMAPGDIVDLKDIVTVENGSKEHEGSFFFDNGKN